MPAGKPEKTIEAAKVLGDESSVYAEAYYSAMVSLKEKIADSEKMLRNTKNPSVVGSMLRRDKLAIIALKEHYGVPLEASEMVMKETHNTESQKERKAA